MHFGEPEQAKTEKAAKIDKSNAVNFHITDDTLGIGGAKEKFKRNIEAIRTLEKIEGENRLATPEEQKILSQYVGWGGLADAFDESKSTWAGEYQELKSLLSDAEYASARESTLNAHYTSPVIIRSIYEALENMGFEKGNVLDMNFRYLIQPSCTENQKKRRNKGFWHSQVCGCLYLILEDV